MNIFTYGSLMVGQVWQRVVIGQYVSQPGVLAGYNRRTIKDDYYPVIFPRVNAGNVPGLIYLDINPDDLTRLDNFEGAYYNRQDVIVHTTDNLPLPCQTYVLKPEYHHLISETIWSEEVFKKYGLDKFLNKYFGFDLLK